MKKLTLLLIAGLCFSVSVGAQTLQENKEIERAKAFVKSKGLTWGGQGDYGTKGLYTYDQSNSRYYGKAYFGVGGNQVQQSAPVRKPKERIPGWFKLPVPVAADPGTLVRKKIKSTGRSQNPNLEKIRVPEKYLNPINDESQKKGMRDKKKVSQPKKKQASNIRRIRGFQPKTKKPVESNKLINTGAINTIQPVGSNKLEKPKTKKPVESNKLINTGAKSKQKKTKKPELAKQSSRKVRSPKKTNQDTKGQIRRQPKSVPSLRSPKRSPNKKEVVINTGAINTIQPVGSNKLEKPKTKKPVESNKLINTGAKSKQKKTKKPELAKQSSRKVRSPKKTNQDTKGQIRRQKPKSVPSLRSPNNDDRKSIYKRRLDIAKMIDNIAKRVSERK